MITETGLADKMKLDLLMPRQADFPQANRTIAWRGEWGETGGHSKHGTETIG